MLTLLIVDQSLSLTLELTENNDRDGIIEEAHSEEQGEAEIGLATNSNSDSTVLPIHQYLKIFG
jgi:hypothetical protein